jgi:hypothetical protein
MQVDADVEQADGTWAGGFYQWAGMLLAFLFACSALVGLRVP